MRNTAEIPGFARFASPIALKPVEPNYHTASLAEIAPRLRVSDELAHHPEWNVAAAPGTTGEDHVVITPKSPYAHSISTEAPGTVEVVVRNFLSQKNGILTFSYDPNSDAKLRFDLYALPPSTLPIETVVRDERTVKHPEALPLVASSIAHATTGSGIWESAQLLSQNEAAKKLGTPVQGLVFTTETSNPETIATLLSDIDNAYQEAYEDSQNPTLNDISYEHPTPQTREGEEWQSDFRYLSPNRRKQHEILKQNGSNLKDKMLATYSLTLLKESGEIYIVLHPGLEPKEAVPAPLSPSGDIFTQVGKILNHRALPQAA